MDYPHGFMVVDGEVVAMTAQQAAALPTAEPAQSRYVPLATIRERVTAAGLWPQFAAALDTLPADKRWHLLTLVDGVAPDDADAISLLTAIGADASEILAP